MKQFGKLFYRPAYLLVIVMLVVVAALPTSASAMLALETLDFNTCSLPGGWTFENPGNYAGATASVQGAYSGEAYLQMTLGAGEYGSITSGSFDAPRLMTPITDASFTVEAKFLTPQISTTTGYKIEGLVFRNDTDPENIKWLRIDFDTRNNFLYSYITYLRSNGPAYIDGSQDDIVPVNTVLPGGIPTEPVLLRVQYNQTTGAWTVTYTVNGTVTTIPFNESDFDATFAPTDAGIFVANSSAMLAHQTRVDYFHVIGTTLNDDATTLTVNKVGGGIVNQTACVGNVVTLQAVPNSGQTFTGWSGDASGTTNPLNVTMTASKTVVANFTGAVEFDEVLYLPIIYK